jgi:hypothetical protein
VGADRHYLNLFALIIGNTASGRKGLAWSEARRPLALADAAWASARIQGGLSSGEGLIHAVRDPLGDDPGEPDKRLLVIETEFAGTLRVMSRDGNTLSVVIRQAWDTGELRVLTRKEPVRATAAHISIIGHVTPSELARRLDRTDVSNGFLNRFVLICARRSQYLPEGGAIGPDDLGIVAQLFTERLAHARSVQRMARDDEARELWATEYPGLANGKPGLLGAALSRAEAQVMRLACIYALLDKSAIVRADHLRSALALWRYVEASSAFVFGGALGDPTADAILAALRVKPEGITRTQIRDLFDRNRSAAEIDGALRTLAEEGLVRSKSEPTQGRPRTLWLTTETTKATKGGLRSVMSLMSSASMDGRNGGAA